MTIIRTILVMAITTLQTIMMMRTAITMPRRRRILTKIRIMFMVIAIRRIVARISILNNNNDTNSNADI